MTYVELGGGVPATPLRRERLTLREVMFRLSQPLIQSHSEER